MSQFAELVSSAIFQAAPNTQANSGDFFALNAMGKTLRRKPHRLLQKSPVKAWTWVSLASLGNVFVACNMGYGVHLRQNWAQCQQGVVLCRGKCVSL
jgi:hypothetical protein